MLIHDCNRCNNNNARNSSRCNIPILSHRHQSNKTPVTFGMFYDKYAKSGWDDSLSFRVAGYNRRKGGRGTPLQGLYVAARRRVWNLILGTRQTAVRPAKIWRGSVCDSKQQEGGSEDSITDQCVCVCVLLGSTEPVSLSLVYFRPSGASLTLRPLSHTKENQS